MTDKRASSVFPVLRNRSFALLWSGQVISSIGSALTALGASILVFRITGSALSVGLILIATAGPTILVGLIAGVFVDRYNRKWILLVSDLSRGLLIALLPILIPINIIWLYIIIALTSAITQFFDSAFASVFPEVISDKELSAANALMAISSVGSTTIGFIAAGSIAAGLNIEWVFYLNACTFGLSALFLLYTYIPKLPTVENTSLHAIGQNLRTGLQTVRTIPVLRSLFLAVIPIYLIFGLQNSLFLPFIMRALNGSEFDFGLQQAAEAVGIALGSLMMARLADRIREGQWLAISFLLMAVESIWYSYSTTIPLAIFLMALSGLVNAPSFIGRQLVIQRATPREMRGRVNSAFFVVRDVMSVAGMAMAGLADVLDVRQLFLISSFGLLGAGIIVLVLPGLGQPAADWKRTLSLLKGTEAAPRLGGGRTATRSEIDRFIERMPEMSSMSLKERERLAAQTLVAEAPPGMAVVYRGEASDAAYFILRGSVGVGYLRDMEYVILNYLHAGDFFGEVAALTGARRTANVITEEDSRLLIIPAKVLRQLAKQYEGLKQALFTTMTERLSQIELPRSAGMDQETLRLLRTNVVD